jgi:hypothetical protein
MPAYVYRGNDAPFPAILERLMAASDHLNKQQFYYHGTYHDFKPGDHVKPAAELASEAGGDIRDFVTNPSDDYDDESIGHETWATTSKKAAQSWAPGGNVYKVRPLAGKTWPGGNEISHEGHMEVLGEA